MRCLAFCSILLYQPLSSLLEENPGPSRARKEEVEAGEKDCGGDELPAVVPEECVQLTTCDVETQTDLIEAPPTMVDAWTQREIPKASCNVQCQFPQDAWEATLADHTYFSSHALPSTDEQNEEEDENVSQRSQMDLFPELGEESVFQEDSNHEDVNMEEEEPMEIVVSQEP